MPAHKSSLQAVQVTNAWAHVKPVAAVLGDSHGVHIVNEKLLAQSGPSCLPMRAALPLHSRHSVPSCGHDAMGLLDWMELRVVLYTIACMPLYCT
jgi:hypothetical protein